MWRPSEIHIWGGYGSQLNALYLQFLLGFFRPNKKFKLIFHSSGVTFREPEVVFLLGSSEWAFVDDFKITVGFFQTPPKRIVSLVKASISFFGFVSTASNLRDLSKIKPWVRQIRGHYSDMQVHEHELVTFLESVMGLNTSELFGSVNSNVLVCQYRLGDLLQLTDKDPVEIDRLVKVFQGLCEYQSINEIKILTDSVIPARETLSGKLDWKGDVSYSCKPPADTLREAVMADYFIGTTSKLSIWIAVIRFYLKKQSITFMPIELSQTLYRKIPGLKTSENFSFY
jgi:hypothetical protein